MRSLSMLRLAAQAPCRSGPVTSSLGVMKSVSAAPSSVNAVGPGADMVGALWRHEAAAGSSSISSASYSNVGFARPSPAAVCSLRRQEGFFCAHVLRRSREPIAVSRFANSACAAPQHLHPLTAGNRGLPSTHPLRLARRPARSAVRGLGRHGRQQSCVCQASVRSAPGMPPNMALNRSSNSLARTAPWFIMRRTGQAVSARLALR